MKNVACPGCEGSRNVGGESGSNCYSCKGTGIREDPLFHKESRCNTCKGFGFLVKDACQTCKGQGILEVEITKNIDIRPFVQDQETLLFKHEGHQTIYKNHNAVNGDLSVKVNLVQSPVLQRQDDNVFSKHYITLGEAIQGKEFLVQTINKFQNVRISQEYFFEERDKNEDPFYKQIVFDGCGVPNTQPGDHICQIYISLPKNLDAAASSLIDLISKEEPSLTSFDPEVDFYKGPNQSQGSKSNFKNDRPFSSYFDQSAPSPKKEEEGIQGAI